MPRVKIFGDRLEPGDVAPRQVRGNPATKAAAPPLQVKKFCINGYEPSAQYWNSLDEAVNQAALYRNREVFSRVGNIASAGNVNVPGSVTGTRHRWRFAFRTGAHTTRIMCAAVMIPPDDGHANPTRTDLTVFSDATESSSVGSASFYYGAGPSGTTDAVGWPYVKTILLPVEGLTANTEYYGRFSDVDYGRIVSASVFELPSLTMGISGYLPQNLNADSEVLHVYRETAATVLKDIWKKNGATLVNFSRDLQSSPRATSSATPTCVIDNSSTTMTAATPAYILDMRYKDRLSESAGIPFTLKVFMWSSAGTVDAEFYLYDSAASAIVGITQPVGTTPQWYSVTGVLPATQDSYSPFYAVNGGTLNVGAFSLYQYES